MPPVPHNNAVITGSLAARIAGNKPPLKPIARSIAMSRRRMLRSCLRDPGALSRCGLAPRYPLNLAAGA